MRCPRRLATLRVAPACIHYSLLIFEVPDFGGQGSIPETKFYPNHNLPTLQSDRTSLPDDIEQAIESDNFSPLTPPLQAEPLMAGSEIESFTNGSVPPRIGARENSTIGQSSVVHITTESNTNRLFQNSPLEVGTSHVSVQSVGTSKISSSEISLNQNGQIEVGTFEIGVSENSPLQVGVTEAGFSEVSTFEVDSFKPDFFQFDSSQIDSSEISFASSVSSEQFFSSHNSTPQIINELNNSATNIWSDLLQSPTQLGIDFQITDLHTGQLAETTITGLNKNGLPNAGTILIDHDANGVGWFIDETPLDNSEFWNPISPKNIGLT